MIFQNNSFSRKKIFQKKFGKKKNSNMQIRIRVRIIEARGLKAADMGGTSDPFCEVRLLNNVDVHKTKVIKKTLDPFWNEEFVLTPSEPEQDVISFKVYDYNAVSNNELLGEFEVFVAGLMYESDFPEKWVELQKKHGPHNFGPGKGEIKVKIKNFFFIILFKIFFRFKLSMKISKKN